MKKLKKYNNKYKEKENNNSIWLYSKKNIMTNNEKEFYDIFCSVLGDNYVVIPQVSLASIIVKKKIRYPKWQNELNRIIDFGIFEKDTFELLLLIEINDNTHNWKYDRQRRDNKVYELCDIAGYEKFLKFLSSDSDNFDFIRSKLYEYLNISDSIQETEQIY